MTQQLEMPAPGGVFITDELDRRAPKIADHLREKWALQDLASQMVDHPGEVLPHLVDLAIELCHGVSGGISLYEEQPAPGVFRWHYLRGDLTRFDGATTPRHFSPCGICLDLAKPVLVQRPERTYTWLGDANVSLPECLLVPLYIEGTQPLGTLWIVSESEGHFDKGHSRSLTELASFAGIALSMLRSKQRLQEALERQELLTREMDHRITNLFAVTDGMIRTSARAALTPQEMADTLSGRLHALASAHALVRPKVEVAGAARSDAELGDLVQAVLRPHGDTGPGAKEKFSVEGPRVQAGRRATTGLALVLHELATNAAKHGALRAEEGCVDVSWRLEDDRLVLRWRERGGPRVETAPTRTGFGGTLARDTVVRQLQGALSCDWRAEGLAVVMTVPIEALSA
jgi:two-component sensor histidine kinase